MRCYKQVTKSGDNQLMETIHAFAQHLNITSNSLKFAILKDRQIARVEAERVGLALYTDRSRRNSLVGIAVA
jgi:hypothetical protein